MAIFPELRDRVVMITGAAEGIGAETARAFARQGSTLALVDINASGLSKVADEVRSDAAAVHEIACDVTAPESVARAFQALGDAGGRLDVLINCAGGYGRLASVEDLSIEEWDRTVALNLRSVFLVSKAAIPLLRQSAAGRIINVASISGRTVFAASSPAYGSSKAAVIQFTRFLAHQLGPAGITANAIAPITTLTPRVAALRTPEEVERIAQQVPMRRLAVPNDHAQAMLFLASDGAAYLNGIVLDVNGGRIMM